MKKKLFVVNSKVVQPGMYARFKHTCGNGRTLIGRILHVKDWGNVNIWDGCSVNCIPVDNIMHVENDIKLI